MVGLRESTVALQDASLQQTVELPSSLDGDAPAFFEVGTCDTGRKMNHRRAHQGQQVTGQRQEQREALCPRTARVDGDENFWRDDGSSRLKM